MIHPDVARLNYVNDGFGVDANACLADKIPALNQIEDVFTKG